jgi:hypothetical protein
MAFFDKTDPKISQKIPLTPRDKFGFGTITSFGKYEFRKINYQVDSKLKNVLLVTADEVVPADKVIYEVKSPLGFPIFKILNTNAQ